jgi:hypothetical protein
MKSHERRTKIRRLQKARRPQFVEALNSRTVLLGLFMVLTIVFASSTAYESGLRTTLTSTSTLTSTATSVSTTTMTSVSVSMVATTSSPNLTKALKDAFLSHISAIETESVLVLAAQYETNVTFVYPYSVTSPTSYGGGGIPNITRFYEAGGPLVGAPLTVPFAVANITYSATMSHDGKEGNVTSRLIFYGSDTQCPAMAISFQCPSGTAFYAVTGFDISYVLQGGIWLISTENVAIINSEMCVPVSLSPDGSVLNCPIYNVPS